MKLILLLWLSTIIIHEHYQIGYCFSNSSFNNDRNHHHLCRLEQRQWLLQLKELGDDDLWCSGDYKPMHWNISSDCCVWDGVSCDESTGDVIGLDLSRSCLTGKHTHSNSSLFRLTHLQKLNLAQNNFGDSEISFNIGCLNSLTHLNLSWSSVSGLIPMEFYHLSNLVSLDITSNFLSKMFGSSSPNLDIKMLFGNMTKIRVLLLNNVNISSEIPMNMSSLLTHLDLGSTRVYGKLPTTIFEKLNLQLLNLQQNYGLVGSLPSQLNSSNVGSIKELILELTSLSGRLPDSLGFMANLNSMLLDGCKFSGPIPESIGNLTKIIEMDLSRNNFNSHLPYTISNLQHLTRLDLSSNHLQGEIPDAFANFQKLRSLLLYNNSFLGPIPSSITNMSQLEALDISSNALTGPFPSRAAGGLQQLLSISLRNNLITGMIPSWLLTLPSLSDLDLSSNRLIGKPGKFQNNMLRTLVLSNNKLNVDLRSFSNFSEISRIDISYNRVMSGGHRSENASLSHLGQLEMSSCEIEEFPNWLRNLPQLTRLDLSNNKIHGPIPSWFKSMRWEYLSYLNISNNHLTRAGYLPWRFLEYLDLHSNSLQGTIFNSICNMSTLKILNLSNNKLSGIIPDCIGNSSSSLYVLDLRRNEFHGTIPTTFGMNHANNPLGFLGLNNNHLEGILPQSLVNCTHLEVLDVGNNMIHDTFPWWLESLTELEVLILKSNRLYGSIGWPSISHSSFAALRILDLSFNNFTGILPRKLFTSFQAMKNQDEATAGYDLYMGLSSYPYQYSMTLSIKGKSVELTKVFNTFTTIDLSSNNFQGGIPKSLAYLHLLRLLNLSHNNISGNIPPALSRITSLEQLDLSSNQLTGNIPSTLTYLTFLAVLNLSYNPLVGRIPEGKQFSTFSNDSYVGNSALCGIPLTRTCGNNGPPPSAAVLVQEEEEEESGFMMGFTWQAVVMGYGVGILFGFIIGNIMFCTGKPKWFVRISRIEAAIWIAGSKKRARAVRAIARR